jgi:TELO2-interacting protein 1
MDSANRLLVTLQQKCQRKDGVFDEKLADYVFFPLSQILRRKQKYNDSLSELIIKCLKLLLEYGWSMGISLDLAKQLLILLTFAAGGVPGQNSTPAPEELVIEAYGALAALFRDLSITAGGSTSVVDSGAIPALGHCVTVLLDGVTDGPSPEAQLQALNALDAVWHCVKDPQALSSILPGTISALTKCLMPSTSARRSRKTIVSALETLTHVLVSILSDLQTRNIKDVEDSGTDKNSLTKSWLKATTGQIKLALSNIIKLRKHESTDVLKALNQLCLTILNECHDTLSESAFILVETCMILDGIGTEEGTTRKTSLTDLAMIHSDLGESIKGIIYNWVTSLPRVMQSNDETAKQSTLNRLSKARKLLVSLNLDSSILEDTLATSLRDGVTVTLESSAAPKALQEVAMDLNSQAAMSLTTDNTLSVNFHPVILSEESQRQTRSQLTNLLANFGTRQSQIDMASGMLEYVRGASGPSLVSSFWLSSQLVRAAAANNKDLDEFFTSAVTLSDEQEAMNQEIFLFSLSIISEAEERTSDWRMQAIALEVVADTAQRLKEEFRMELVDALYPVTQLLGSPNTRLREHAITCLNIVSKACGYVNVSDMIVDNVDYMVNAISLRLNTFNISPQAPQVLVMMIRLTGPSLLLYLDDVVESIFAALDNFHGYQRLVDLLFSVLGEIVNVGSTSGQLQIEGGADIDHRKKGPSIPTIEEIIELLKKKLRLEDESLPHEDFPRAPWKDAKTLLDEADASKEGEEPEQDERAGEIQKPPPTKVYIMVQRIARLGQHYLTSQSPVLRARLLGLVGTACKALHNNEDEFLPLINDIWPTVIKRLYDEEPFVVIAAADAVAEICRCAGDFMATRMQTEWPDLMKMARQARGKVAAEKKGSGSRGIYSQASQVWEGVVGLLIAMLDYVQIDDEMFDEVVELLAELIPIRRDVRDALSGVNGDAVWLAMQKAGKNEEIERPVLNGHEFALLDKITVR